VDQEGEGRGRGIYGRSGGNIFLQLGSVLIYLLVCWLGLLFVSSGGPGKGVAVEVAIYLWVSFVFFRLGAGRLRSPLFRRCQTFKGESTGPSHSLRLTGRTNLEKKFCV